MSKELEAKAHNERRLGLLIMENKSGPALAAGVTHLRAAAEAWEQAGWPQRKAECLVDLGKLNTKRQAYNEAAEAFVDAARILDAADTAEKDASDAHAGAGIALRSVGRIDASVRHLRKALKLSTKLNDLLRKAEHQMELGASLIEAEEPEAAIEASEAALECFTNYKQGSQRARCMEQLGMACAALDRHEEAAAHIEAAAAMDMELGRRFEATEVLSRFADMQSRRGEHASALALLERCLQIHEQDHNRAMIATTNRLKGMVHQAAGQLREARDCFEESLDLCIGLKDHEGEARALYHIGGLENRDGDVAAALETLEWAKSKADEASNLKIKERALAAIAKIQRKCEKHEEAITTMHEWVEVLKQLGERQEQLRVLGSMASIHQERGALVEAEAHLRRLISVCNQDEDEAERLYAHHGLAVLLSKRLQHREAGEHFRQAMVGYRKLFGDERSERQSKLLATLHYQYASELLREGQADDALMQFEASLGLEGQDENQRARVLVGMGNAHRMSGNENAAGECFAEAAELCELQGDIRATSIIRKASSSGG